MVQSHNLHGPLHLHTLTLMSLPNSVDLQHVIQSISTFTTLSMSEGEGAPL